MLIDLDALKASPSDYDLYQIAYRRAGATTGVHDIGDISELKIGPNLRFRLAEASIQHEAAIAAAAAPPPPPPAPTELQINFADVEAEQQRDIQRRADAASARNRLDQYSNEQGLEPSDHNVNLIKDFVNQSAGYWSAEIIDVAVSYLRDKLTWKPKEQPAPTPPAATVEVLEPLPNGEPRLPIDASEFLMRRASVKQLLDLNQRRREASGQTIIGKGKQINRIGSKF